VAVSCITAGYAFEAPLMELWTGNGRTLLDSGMALTASGKLNVTWAEGKIHVALGDQVLFGESFQIRLKANSYSTVSTLRVTVPAENRSNATVTLKAAGSLDVLRDGSAVTVTPTYKNCSAGKAWTENLLVYTSADKYKEAKPAETYFNVTRDEAGRFVLTRKAGLNYSLKYRVQLESSMEGFDGQTYSYRSAQVNINVKMGSVKLTMSAPDTTLFARDKNDRIVVRFTAADASLNAVKKVEIRDARYRNVFEVLRYGNGEFAIAFKDGKVDKSIQGKTIPLNLNVFMEGNTTTRVNATARVNIQILK
jgi:hypothetical protein